MKVLYVLGGYADFAVMVFFVLSGYLVGGAVIRASRDGRWSWSDYLLRRGTRLYIVLIPALLLTLCWDYGEAAQVSGLTPNSDTGVATVRSEMIRDHTSATIFLGNAAFLQTVFVPPLGSNLPLWSLTNEFWYYLVFPLLWFAVQGSGIRMHVRVTYAGVAVLILCLLGQAIAVYFAIWLLGVIVAQLHELKPLQNVGLYRLVAFLVGCLFLITLLVIPTAARKLPNFLRHVVVSLAFGLLLYCLKHNRRPAKSPRFRRVVTFFANFSYTLYLVHLPPLVVLRACLTYESSWLPVASAWLMLAGILSGVLVYAYLVALVTEYQTEPLRHWLSRHFCGPKRQEPQLTVEVMS